MEDLDKYLRFCSLDLASGFWVVQMTDRAKAISAFITPFGLFQWKRMPFGLKSAPQIYQRVIDNALYGILKITRPEDESLRELAMTRDGVDVFSLGDAVDPNVRSIPGRRSYIDDILIGRPSWDELCASVDALLEVCDYWGLSISVAKSSWGKQRVDYLGHSVSANGLQGKPKNLDQLAELSFPSSLKGMQSFLGSLNYYHRFVEDFAIYAAVLYELKEEHFALPLTNARMIEAGPPSND